MNDESIVFLSLGTNQGDRLKNLEETYRLLEQRVGKIRQKSSVYITPPWGFESNTPFLNTVIALRTTLSPQALMDVNQDIEKELGRVKKQAGVGYSDRPIDIDIISFDDRDLTTPKLNIPHPRAHERKFVLIPLYEIAPKWKHPRLKKTITELILTCSDRSKIHIY